MNFFFQLLVFILLFGLNAKAQQRFQLLYHPAYWQHSVSMKHAIGGGFLLVSNITEMSGETGILITRFDNSLNTIWEKEINDSSVHETALSFFQDNTGCIFIGGHKNGAEILLLKTDSMANIIWAKNYNIPSSKCITINGSSLDGIFILISKNWTDSVVAISCDTSGNVQWTTNIFDSTHPIQAITMAYQPYTLLVFFSVFFNNSSAIGLQFMGSNGALMGGQLLTGYYTNNSDPAIYDIVTTSTQGFCLLSYCITNQDYHPCIAVIDAAGNVTRTKAYDILNNFSKVVETNDGGFCVATKISGVVHQTHLIKFDYSLNIQWIRQYQDANLSEITSLLKTADNGFCISGYNSLNQIVIIKTDSLGNSSCSDSTINIGTLTGGLTSYSNFWTSQQQNYITGNYGPSASIINSNALDTLCIYTGKTEVIRSSSLTLIPNPASTLLTINSEQNLIKEIGIFNLMGENIYSAAANSEHYTVNCEQWPEGIYFVVVSDAKGNKITEMISVMR